MNISDYLSAENIFLDADLKDKTAVLGFIADACEKNRVAENKDEVYQGLLEREQTMSTGVGGGLAFPHTTSAEAKQAAVILLRLSRPVDFDALDKKPVDIILSLIIPQKDREIHVRLLARISRLCRDPAFIEALRNAADPFELRTEMQKVEQEKAPG
ncbi:MAG: PTS sugar transporter subunit IIA [Thermodesulfobacteriota bacterium]